MTTNSVQGPPDGASRGAADGRSDAVLLQDDASDGDAALPEEDASDADSAPLPDDALREADSEPSQGSPQSEAGAGIAHIVVTNTTAAPLTVSSYYVVGGTPQWLHIGSPELPLIVIGDSPGLCGGGHNDPFWQPQAIPTGGAISYDWDGGYMFLTSGSTGADSSGPCWQHGYAPPGSYPASACASAAGGPFDGAGAGTCVSFTVTLPASGKMTSSASW
ncbi:MAG: hypothetical protein M3O46_00965 [Myxococcota bacterium]|nr:hypothetical protein [Myxococcota bacterium]